MASGSQAPSLHRLARNWLSGDPRVLGGPLAVPPCPSVAAASDRARYYRECARGMGGALPSSQNPAKLERELRPVIAMLPANSGQPSPTFPSIRPHAKVNVHPGPPKSYSKRVTQRPSMGNGRNKLWGYTHSSYVKL